MDLQIENMRQIDIYRRQNGCHMSHFQTPYTVQRQLPKAPGLHSKLVDRHPSVEEILVGNPIANYPMFPPYWQTGMPARRAVCKCVACLQRSEREEQFRRNLRERLFAKSDAKWRAKYGHMFPGRRMCWCRRQT